MGIFDQPGCPIALHSNRLSSYISCILGSFALNMLKGDQIATFAVHMLWLAQVSEDWETDPVTLHTGHGYAWLHMVTHGYT